MSKIPEFHIIDANFSQKNWGLAASWLRWEFERRGFNESNLENAKIVLISTTSPQALSIVKKWLSLIDRKRQTVILGGSGAFQPAAFLPYVDYINVGEGGGFVEALFDFGLEAALGLPNVIDCSNPKQAKPCLKFPWYSPPIFNADGFWRVFGSRSCPHRCRFCQTSWEASFVKHPDLGALRRQINFLRFKKRKFSVVTNDGGIDGSLELGFQEFVSVTGRGLRDIVIDRKKIKTIRVGVEGVSERLRKAVKKPCDMDVLLSKTYEALQSGVGVKWFFIAGLPGETFNDYDELKKIISIIRNWDKGLVYMIFHAFIPFPATPLGVLPLVDEYFEHFTEFQTWFFWKGGFTKRINIMAPAQYKTRLKHSKLVMGHGELDLRNGFFDIECNNWNLVSYPKTPENLRSIARKYQASL